MVKGKSKIEATEDHKEWKDNKHKRGQHNPKYGKSPKRATGEGLQGHNENHIGHKAAGPFGHSLKDERKKQD